jgi:ribonuclease HI
VAVNTDACFCVDSGKASPGVVVRSENGQVILSAWRLLRRCSSVEEAEVEACLEGVRLTAEWVRQSAILKTDCSTIVSVLQSGRGERMS